MILSQVDIRKAVDNGEIRFDLPLQTRQWGEASVDLRLGNKFTKLKPSPGVKLSLAHGIGSVANSGLWEEGELPLKMHLVKRSRIVSIQMNLS
jgi:hypothetical protein